MSQREPASLDRPDQSTAEVRDGAGWIEVFAPATVANVGPGFDCFGFALDGLGDVVQVRRRSAPGIEVIDIEGDQGLLPRQADANTAAVAADAIWRDHSELSSSGLQMRIIKGMPACSGLGSSAASAVGGAVAAMHAAVQALGIDYCPDRVLAASLVGEAVASGAPHADNVAPSLMGGFTVVGSGSPPKVARFEPKLACSVAVVTPRMSVSTREAREVLPDQIPLSDAVANWSRTAALILAMCTGDAELLQDALVDVVVEPRRARLIPGAADAKAAAVAAGAWGCGISGSGPTLFCLAADVATAKRSAAAIEAVFRDRDLQSTSTITTISPRGAHVR